MLFILFQFDGLAQVIQAAVDAGTDVTAFARILKDFLIFALAGTDDRCQDLHPSAFRITH